MKIREAGRERALHTSPFYPELFLRTSILSGMLNRGKMIKEKASCIFGLMGAREKEGKEQRQRVLVKSNHCRHCVLLS